MGRESVARPLPIIKDAAQGIRAPVVIVGNGPVGIKAAQLLNEKHLDSEIVIFGEEVCLPYNRVQLSNYLAGKVTKEELFTPLTNNSTSKFTQHVGRKVVSIDRINKFVLDDQGEKTAYSKLILATGSKPYIPELPNLDLQGVYQFRTLQDTLALVEQKNRSKNFYVVGSGPLGLETALAMKKPNNRVVLESRKSLLNHQLGSQAQLILNDFISASGVEIESKNPLVKIHGKKNIESVELEDGKRYPCDCLIFCSGVVPETRLADASGLSIRRGIVVDEYMRTSDPDIYAIGECCEYEQQTYGVVAPGLKQAKSCVEHINGCIHEFANQSPDVKVKLGEYSTGYYGTLDEPDCEVFTHVNRLKGIYRKLVVKKGVLIGAIIIGKWDDEPQAKSAIQKKEKLKLKQLKKFEREGNLYSNPQQRSVKALPSDYIICLCDSVTKGELSQAIESGCRTIECLGEKTSAGTTCGSCKPLLADLLDTPAPNLVMRHQKAIYATSILSILLIIMTIFIKPMAIAESVQMSWRVEMLWFDNFWKQVSGYSLLGLCVIATALAARKRIKNFKIGHVDSWRYAHSVVGILALLVLMIHTGMRLGHNLNLALMAVFLAATVTGSLVGIFMARNHHWSDFKLRQHRLWWSRVHHTLLWMLPPLLGFHILSAYYF